jgi:D-arginine dehydrogenase
MIFDVAIVGAGIAGASLAAEIAGKKSVLLLEQEGHPGYHATGRSAAFWTETYGGPDVQPLTSASGHFFAAPPPGFTDIPLVKPRGALHLGQKCDASAARHLLADFKRSGVALERLDSAGIATHIQGLRDGWTEALWEPDCSDIDVGALHAAYLKTSRKAGAVLTCNAALRKAVFSAGRWTLETPDQMFSARTLVNAAGAWADEVAKIAGVKAIGITPYRRTIIQLAVDPAASPHLPLTIGLDGSFYFKPEPGGRIWLSPHDESASAPCDAAPEEIDVARAIDRFQEVVDWRILKLERKWAGLRSFAPDRLPVIGRDAAVPEFFWLAGQGGFGIQTAPAIAAMAGAILCDQPNPVPEANPATYAPERLH